MFADCGILKTTRFIGDFRKEAGSMRTTMGDDDLIRVGIHDEVRVVGNEDDLAPTFRCSRP